jgi:hypothetical protein
LLRNCPDKTNFNAFAPHRLSSFSILPEMISTIHIHEMGT